MNVVKESADTSLDARRVVLGTIVVLGVASGFGLVYWFSTALSTIFLGMVLGTSVRPLLGWPTKLGLSRLTSALVAYAGLLALVGVTMLLVVPAFVEQVTAFLGDLPVHAESARRRLEATSSLTLQTIAGGIPADLSASSLPELAAPARRPTLADMGSVAKGIFTLVAMLILGFYWTLEGEQTVRALVLPLGLGHREKVREFLESAEARVGGYVRGQFAVSLATTVMSFAAFVVIGLPNALVLAFVAGVAAAVPIFGAPLGAVPPLLLALSMDPALVPPVLLAVVVIHLVKEYVVAPRLLGGATGVHPFTILLAVTGLSSLLGLTGALLATPFAAILQVLFDRLVLNDDPPATPLHRDRLSVLRLEARQLALDVRRQAREKPTELTSPLTTVVDMVESIANDVDRMLAEARPREGTP